MTLWCNQQAARIDASHAVVYSGPAKTCYDHGGALHDFNTKRDAKYYYCDTLNPSKTPCGSEYQSRRWNKTKKGLHGLDLLYVTITGSATRMSPRLWIAAMLASSWALLRR